MSIRTARFMARLGDRTTADVVRRYLPHYSSAAIEQAFAESGILGGDSRPDQPVLPGEVFLLRYERHEPAVPVQWSIVYAGEDILVCNKGAGYPVHPSGAYLQRTLLHAVREAGYRDARPVHRLDLDTTGVVAFALTSAAAKRLSRAFAEHSAIKTYVAVVGGTTSQREFWIDAPLGPAPGSARGLQAVRPDGKYARTYVEVLRCSTDSSAPARSIVVATPETGRRHQIRVHLAHAGLPLWGDIAYGGATHAPRPLLHAWRLALPSSGGAPALEVEAPWPIEITEAFDACR